MKNYVAWGVIAVACVLFALSFMWVNIKVGRSRTMKAFTFYVMCASLGGAAWAMVMFCIRVLGATK